MNNFFIRDFWWKLLAFVLATLVWANFGGKLKDRIELDTAHVNNFGTSNPDTKVESKPMLRTIMALRGPEITNSMRIEPPEATIIVRVEASRYRTLDPKQILAFVDVTDMNDKQGWAASARRTSRVIQVVLPTGVELISVEPKTVIVERNAPVEPAAQDDKVK